MWQLIRVIAIVCVFILATGAWFVLGGIMSVRTSEQQSSLYGAVADLWGQPLDQNAPELTFRWQEDVVTKENMYAPDGKPLIRDGAIVQREVHHLEWRDRSEKLASTRVDTGLSLDLRRKGLMWFSLYDVAFDGTWTYVHEGPQDGSLLIRFPFPVAGGMYDDFQFDVDGKNVADDLLNDGGSVSYSVPVELGQTVTFRVGYKSRGMDHFAYHPTKHVAEPIRDFRLTMTTDFDDIDYPQFTLSPSSSECTSAGCTLDWTFSRVVTSSGMGMVTPNRIQPGPLAASLAFSAPISLGLFMLWIWVIGLLRSIDIHPVHHLFLAGAFFAFHLLFGYSVDHLPVEAAFAISAAVSVVLVVSYLRLAVGLRFAWREAGLAQLVYLVGFSLAHFWDGYTGLTVTILGILTLFALMQLTGRVKWSSVFTLPDRAAAR